jgi:leucyl aminopeptidase
MNVTVSKTSLVNTQTDAVVVTVFEEEPTLFSTTRALDEACGGILSHHLQTGDFQAKPGQTSILYVNRSSRLLRILVVGLGKRKTFKRDVFRAAVARAAQQVRSLRLTSFAMGLNSGDLEISPCDLAEAAVEGALLGLYQFTACKTMNLEQFHQVREMVLCEENRTDRSEITAGVEYARTVCDAVLFVRDLVSMPANRMTPTHLALAAQGLCRGRKSLTCRILDESRMKKLGMNALLGVARGSEEPPRFIILEYRGGKKSDPSIVLVGKGLTFDSGGISLKPAEKMDEMKTDMAGAAAVLGALRAAADLKLP